MNRYYDPGTGRYISTDPVGLAVDGNAYRYGYNNPALVIDPHGDVGFIGAGIGAVIGGVSGYMYTGTWQGALGGAAIGGAAGFFGQFGTSLGAGMMIGALVGGGEDIAFQMIIQGRSFRCVDYGQTGRATLLGGVSAGAGHWFGKWMAARRAAKALNSADEVVELALEGEDAFQTVLNKVDELDFRTPHNKATFYSGSGQGARAQAFAEKTGSMTIEMTQGGKQLMSDPLFQQLSPAQQYQVWQKASKPFAEGASGKINAFTNGARPTGTFKTIEEPALKINPNVHRYIYHY